MVLKAGQFQIKSLTESNDSQCFSAQLIQESVHLKLKLPGPEFSENDQYDHLSHSNTACVQQFS